MLALLCSHRQGPHRNTALTKQRSGGQKKLTGSGTGCEDAESAALERKM
jgi:hypothetical protein